VDYLERRFKQEDVALAYIYCSYKEQEDQTAANLIASLLQQLVQRKSIVSEDVASLYLRHVSARTRPTLGEWSKLLQSEVHRFSKVFIVVDALDECSGSNGTRDSFLIEIQKLQPRIHLLVTSRLIPNVEHTFETAIRMDICASREDIRRYLNGRINREHRVAGPTKDNPDLREEIINTIAEKAEGM